MSRVYWEENPWEGTRSADTGEGARDARRALGGTGRSGLCGRAGHWEGQGTGGGAGRGLVRVLGVTPTPFASAVCGGGRTQEAGGGVCTPAPTSLSSLTVPRLEDETQKREDAEKSLVLFRKVRGLGGPSPHAVPNPHLPPPRGGAPGFSHPLHAALQLIPASPTGRGSRHAVPPGAGAQGRAADGRDRLPQEAARGGGAGVGWGEGEQLGSLCHDVMPTHPRRSCGTWR